MKGVDNNTNVHSTRSERRCQAAQKPSRYFPWVEDRMEGFMGGVGCREGKKNDKTTRDRSSRDTNCRHRTTARWETLCQIEWRLGMAVVVRMRVPTRDRKWFA